MKKTATALFGFLLCLSLLGTSAGQTATKGGFAISGYVVDTAGAAVPDATVNVIDFRGSFDHPVPSVQTTKDGYFQAFVYSNGTYRLLPWKQSAGVPNPLMSIYESPDVNYPWVTIVKNVPVHDLRLTLPKPFGRLIGRVIDQDKNSEISTARVTLTYADDETVYLSKGIGKEGKLDLLLPPKPIHVVISAPGYKAWSLKSTSISQDPVLLRSGELTELLVRLQPET